MRLLYNIGIFLYLLAVHVASWFDPKARKWLRGRKHLHKNFSGFKPGNKPVAWFHSASLGEFEQGRPAIEEFRKRNPGHFILLTFFSPSGFEIKQNYEQADYVCYLPADTPSGAKRFVDAVNPALVVFVKYEYWHNIMHEITRRAVPLYVMSAVFRPAQYFFKWYGRRFVKNLAQITHFFVQNHESADLLKAHGILQVTIAGDTRFDRVARIAAERVSLPLIEKFIEASREIIVAGSTWYPDEVLLAKLLIDHPDKYKLIIAPHEISESHLQKIEALFKGVVARYSQVKPYELTEKKVLIIDSIGLLSKLYRHGRYAFIGGGFGAGIHNVPEAAVYGIPVIFGPNFTKFNEAADLIRVGGAFSVKNYPEFKGLMRNLSGDQKAWHDSAEASRKYVAHQVGATEKVIEMICRNLH